MRNAAAFQICKPGDGFFNSPPVDSSSATTGKGKKNTAYFPSGSANRSPSSVPRCLLRGGKVPPTLNSFFFDLPLPWLPAHTASLASALADLPWERVPSAPYLLPGLLAHSTVRCMSSIPAKAAFPAGEGGHQQASLGGSALPFYASVIFLFL